MLPNKMLCPHLLLGDIPGSCCTVVVKKFAEVIAQYHRYFTIKLLVQHAELDFHSASSLKQQSADTHVAPLGHIILIPSQPVFALTP
jgi:hypothetical protein